MIATSPMAASVWKDLNGVERFLLTNPLSKGFWQSLIEKNANQKNKGGKEATVVMRLEELWSLY